MALVRLTKRLWKEYLHQTRVRASRQAQENRLRRKRQDLIVAHLPLAESIARQVWRRFTRSGQGGYGSKISLEDMVSCAHVGLVEAAGRWDPGRGEFGKYCYLRVRGAIIDAHRRQAYLETQHTSVDAWFEDIEGDDAHRDLVGRYLSDTSPLPDARTQERQLERLARVAIERLPDDERDVIREALAGCAVAAIGQSRGHTPAWARAKLATARDKVAAEVQRWAA
jgi:RNA polymerase sigma factor (sigma-70 family)